VGPAAVGHARRRRRADDRGAAVAELGSTGAAPGSRWVGGQRTVASLGCARGPATSSRCAAEHAAGSAGCGPDLGSAHTWCASCSDIPGGSHVGRRSAAASPCAGSGPFVGSIWTGRAACAHVGLVGARAFLGATASRAIVGCAQARGPARARTIVGRAAFGAAFGATFGATFGSAPGAASPCPFDSPGDRGPVVGEPTRRPVLGYARGGVPGRRAGSGLGSTGAFMGCPGGSRPQRTTCARTFVGPTGRHRGLGCAQERGTGSAACAVLVGRAASATSNLSASAATTHRGSAACVFSAQRGSVVVAPGRAGSPPEVPGTAARRDRGFAPGPGPRAGSAALGGAGRVGPAGRPRATR